jgi:hypothetical protein
MFKTVLTKLTKYIDAFQIDDTSITLSHNHKIQFVDMIINHDDRNTIVESYNAGMCIMCEVCGLLEAKILVDFRNKQNIDLNVHMYYINNKSHRYAVGIIVNEDIVYNLNTIIDRDVLEYDMHRYIYDDKYEYQVYNKLFKYNNITTKNYSDIVKYISTLFIGVILPDINNIIIDYILVDISLVLSIS